MPKRHIVPVELVGEAPDLDDPVEIVICFNNHAFAHDPQDMRREPWRDTIFEELTPTHGWICEGGSDPDAVGKSYSRVVAVNVAPCCDPQVA